MGRHGKRGETLHSVEVRGHERTAFLFLQENQMKGGAEQKDMKRGQCTPSPYPGIKEREAGQSLGPLPLPSPPPPPCCLFLRQARENAILSR